MDKKLILIHLKIMIKPKIILQLNPKHRALLCMVYVQTLRYTLTAKNIVKLNEPIERYCIYLTNQHTDMHLLKKTNCRYETIWMLYCPRKSQKKTTQNHRRGHMFSLYMMILERLNVGPMNQQKDFRKIVKKLRPEDIVKLYGVLRQGTFNIEKFYVVKLNKFEYKNPKCKMWKRMTSAGKGKGF